MKSFFLLFSLIFSTQVYSAEFSCSNGINGNEISKVSLKTKIGSRVQISDEGDFVSYISENKPNQYTLEFFSVNDHIRVYSEAFVTNEKEFITAATWSDQKMITVKCYKIKQ